MRVKHWVLSVAAVLAVFTTTPAIATSSCGNRSDLGEGPRLTILGLTEDQRLVQFRECNPGRLKEIGSVYGLQSPDTALVGIDFRVQDGQLYGVGNAGGIYTIDTYTAVATLVSQLLSPWKAPSSAWTLIRRLIGCASSATPVRIWPTTSTLGGRRRSIRCSTIRHRSTSTLRSESLGLPTRIMTSVTRRGQRFSTSIQMRNQVAIQSPPAQGALVAVGSLTVDPDTPVGFDIYTDLRKGVAFNNRGFASLVVGDVSGFYRVNLLTGRAILIGNFYDTVIDIAIPLDQ